MQLLNYPANGKFKKYLVFIQNNNKKKKHLFFLIVGPRVWPTMIVETRIEPTMSEMTLLQGQNALLIVGPRVGQIMTPGNNTLIVIIL